MNYRDMKLKLDQGSYKKACEIEEDFYGLIEERFEGIARNEDFYTRDLMELSETTDFLLDQVLKIHREESSPLNRELFKANIDIKTIRKSLEDGKSGVGIYYLGGDWDYFLVGDIHSDSFALRKILERTEFFERIKSREKIRLVFLGDYVDRGQNHIKSLHYILALKYLFKENIYLLRGNHDTGEYIDGQIKMRVGTSEEDRVEKWFLKYLVYLSQVNESFKESLIFKYLEFFDSLSNLAFIDKSGEISLLSHGGIPRYRFDSDDYYDYLETLSDLSNEEILDNIGRTIVHNMMWSDPSEDPEADLIPDNGRFVFLEEHFESFRSKIGFDKFYRGHEAKLEGRETMFKERLTTIFSSGTILKDGENINQETAYEKVSPKLIMLGDSEEVLINIE